MSIYEANITILNYTDLQEWCKKQIDNGHAIVKQLCCNSLSMPEIR